LKRGYSLELRLAAVGASVTALTLSLAAAVVAMEFIRGEFAIEERSLLAQAAEWAQRVETDVSGGLRFDPPDEPSNGPDAPYTGLLKGPTPIYGYALLASDGREIASSTNYVLSRTATVARPGEPTLLEGPDRTSGNLLFVAEVYLPEHDAFLRVARLRSDEGARANTFFAHVLEDLGWLALAILVGVTVATAITIRISLAGLKRVARQAELLDVENLATGHLDAASAPREIQPIVTAFNACLARISSGMQAKREFSIHVAHELRTPLADLRLRIEGADTGEDQSAMLRDIDAMSRLIEQLLHIARLDASASFTLAPLDLTQTVPHILSDLAPRLVARGWDLELIACKNTKVWVIGDEILIALVLRNLLENVIRHAGPGGIVQVSIGPGPQLMFSDNGTGVPPAARPHLFERFTVRRGDLRNGSGLGLAICRSAMERLGGGIELAQPAPGPGSCFIMRFQAAEAPLGPKEVIKLANGARLASSAQGDGSTDRSATAEQLDAQDQHQTIRGDRHGRKYGSHHDAGGAGPDWG
jgi:signal transduction histidine kinase